MSAQLYPAAGWAQAHAILPGKLVEWKTNGYQTVVLFIDPRRHVSFGRGKA